MGQPACKDLMNARKRDQSSISSEAVKPPAYVDVHIVACRPGLPFRLFGPGPEEAQPPETGPARRKTPLPPKPSLGGTSGGFRKKIESPAAVESLSRRASF
jgi:hypothetical protein